MESNARALHFQMRCKTSENVCACTRLCTRSITPGTAIYPPYRSSLPKGSRHPCVLPATWFPRPKVQKPSPLRLPLLPYRKRKVSLTPFPHHRSSRPIHFTPSTFGWAKPMGRELRLSLLSPPTLKAVISAQKGANVGDSNGLY